MRTALKLALVLLGVSLFAKIVRALLWWSPWDFPLPPRFLWYINAALLVSAGLVVSLGVLALLERTQEKYDP